MKMIRSTTLFFLSVCLAASLTACDPTGTNYNTDSVTMDTIGPLPAASGSVKGYIDSGIDSINSNISISENRSNAANTNVVSETKLIRTVSMIITLDRDDTLLETVTELGASAMTYGGYISRKQIETEEYHASASISLMIPKSKVDSYLNEIKGKHPVTSLSENTEDVTDKYIDTESRLKVKEAAKEKYLTYLETAETVSDVLEIEDRLNNTIADIESSKAILASLDRRIDYSAVDIQIQCKKIVEQPSFWEEAKEDLSDILHSCAEFVITGFGMMLHLLIFCFYLLPVLFIGVRIIRLATGRYGSIRNWFRKKK